MKRIKKNLTKDQLKEHIINWVLDQVDELKDLSLRIQSDESIPEEEKPWIMGGIARQVKSAVALMEPISHEEEADMAWAIEFVTTYDQEASDYSYRSLN